MRKRKTRQGKVVARNSIERQRKRFGKKEKRRLIIAFVLAFVLFLGISRGISYLNDKRAEVLNQARKGEVTQKKAEKEELDDDGQVVKKDSVTTVTVFDVGKGSMALISHGDTDLLIDAGSKKAGEKVADHITGDLEYLIVTNGLDENVRGLDALYEKVNVKNTLLSNAKIPKSAKNVSKIDEQIIDMGDGVSVYVRKGLGGSSAKDKNAVVILKDENSCIVFAQNASEANAIATITQSLNTDTRVDAYVIGSLATSEDCTNAVLRLINTEVVIRSTDDATVPENIQKEASINYMPTETCGNITITLKNGFVENTKQSKTEKTDDAG